MSVGSFLAKLNPFAKKAASVLTQAIAAAAKPGNPIGDAIIAAAAAIENSGLSGAEKKAHVIDAVIELAKTEIAKGGVSAIVADVEQFLGMVVEEVVGKAKETPLMTIATAFLKLLGVK